MALPQPCLLAAVDLNRRAEGVIRRAAKLAQFGGLSLVIVHAVEYDTGFESDHVPFMTPAQLREGLARDARAWLLGLLHHMDLAQAEIMVQPGKPAEVLAALVAERRARYVVTGALKWGALSKLAELSTDRRVVDARCDILHAGGDATRWTDRLSRWAGRLLLGSERRL